MTERIISRKEVNIRNPILLWRFTYRNWTNDSKSTWKQSWNEAMIYFEGLGGQKETKWNWNDQAGNEEKFLKWRRWRDKLFRVRFKMLLFQQKDVMEGNMSEADYLSWKRSWHEYLMEHGYSF
jgi:hypothetical protein